MTIDQVRYIVEHHLYPGAEQAAELVETHISWVILTRKFVFKIKKPIQLSFLDFSTKEKRAFYCREELHLNKRLAPEMYLDVLPIRLSSEGHPVIGAKDGDLIDMAIWMNRMDNSRQMDHLLHQNAVTDQDMASLAQVLAAFHRSVIIPAHEVPYRIGDNWADFDDLFKLKNDCVQLFGAEASEILEQWRSRVGLFLQKHEPRLQARAQSGYWIDGHGDLHGRNIFLLADGPVIFDCIEFNPHFRKLDVLNELAFLCMDLDANGHPERATVFMENYCSHWPCMETPEDALLFQYFKTYRANVRLKVTLMEWQQHRSAVLEASAATYWNLMEQYLRLL